MNPLKTSNMIGLKPETGNGKGILYPQYTEKIEKLC